MAKLITPVGLLSFPYFFTPKPRVDAPNPSYHCSLIFDRAAQSTPAFRALRAAVDALAQERAPSHLKTMMRPWRAGADKVDKHPEAYGQDDVYISPWSYYPPDVVDARKALIADPSRVWAGQLARLQVEPFFWEGQTGRGISFSLLNVQIVDTSGPRIDGRMSAAEAFADTPTTIGEIVDRAIADKSDTIRASRAKPRHGAAAMANAKLAGEPLADDEIAF
jgi:hypothetical protein